MPNHKPKIVTPQDFAGFQPSIQEQILTTMAQDTQRIAVGLDMLVGLLAEVHGYELKEVSKDEQGNTMVKWMPKEK